MTPEPAATDRYSTGMLSKDTPHERERLESIQRGVDACTTGLIEQLGVRADWNCLELGAGAGSVAYWLAERCPQGRTVAVDVDTRYLDAGRAPNLEVVEADITDAAFAPGRFDLVHARFLFCHLAGRDEAVARAAEWLAPGGRVLVEEPYHLPAETSPSALVRRVLAAYQRKYADSGADMTWARGLPGLLARSGLTDVSYSGNLGRMGGGEQDRWLPLVRQAAPAMLADGLVTEDELERFADLLADPSFLDIPQITISAWGCRG